MFCCMQYQTRAELLQNYRKINEAPMAQSIPLSPLAPKAMLAKNPKLPSVAGVRFGVGASGERYKNRDDVLFAHFDEGSKIAGVTTQSSMPSASVDWCRRHLPQGKARGLVVNAGNANAFTGKQGVKAAHTIAARTAALLDCPIEQVFTASTGVIGEDLRADIIVQSLEKMPIKHKSAWHTAAAALMTTDTFPKFVTRQVTIGGQKITLSGIAKGSGMIAPDMATLLGFFFTDAALSPAIMRQLLREIVPQSFNAITVDSDTSTSDMVLLVATQKIAIKGAPLRSVKDKRLAPFKNALLDAMKELAQLVVRDGEGATKFISVTVKGAKTDAAARVIALSIANSPLVKTAIAGEDANWGRIVMAVGKSGEIANRDKLKITIGGVAVARHGRAVAGYDEKPVTKHMKGQEIDIETHIGVGKGRAQVWTSDLTHGYISINADYRS